MSKFQSIFLFFILFISLPNASMAQFDLTLGLGFEEQTEKTAILLEISQEVIQRRLKYYGTDSSLYQLEIKDHELKIHLSNTLDIDLIRQLILTKGKIKVQEIHDDFIENIDRVKAIEAIFVEAIRPQLSQYKLSQKYGFQEGMSIWQAELPLLEKIERTPLGNLSITRQRQPWVEDLLNIPLLKILMPDLPDVAWKKSPKENPELFFLKGDALNLTNYLDTLFQAQDNFNEPTLNLKLNEEGAELFAQITEKNIKQRLAFMLDHQVLIVPMVHQAIIGGSMTIQGGWYEQQENFKLLQSIMMGGSLDDSLQFLSENIYRR